MLGLCVFLHASLTDVNAPVTIQWCKDTFFLGSLKNTP